MTKTFNIGVIGAGMMGKGHIQALQMDERAVVKWVCDIQEPVARDAAQQFKIPQVALDYKAVLADPEVDAVIIVTPPYTHAEMFVAALEAGKNVLIEKPMGASMDEVRQIVAAAAKHPSQVILEASCRHARLQPKFAFVRDLIASGKLGQVYYIHHNHLGQGTFIEYNKNGAWAMDKKLAGGGPFIDWGVYDLSFHLGILGDTPQLLSVRRFTRNDLRDMGTKVAFSDVEQHAAAWLEFSDGLTYFYERGSGVHGETKCETRIQGTKGGLRLYYPSWESPEIEYFTADPDPKQETLRVDMSAHVSSDNLALINHFLDCLQGKAQPMMTVERAARHLEMLFKILE